MSKISSPFKVPRPVCVFPSTALAVCSYELIMPIISFSQLECEDSSVVQRGLSPGRLQSLKCVEAQPLVLSGQHRAWWQPGGGKSSENCNDGAEAQCSITSPESFVLSTLEA